MRLESLDFKRKILLAIQCNDDPNGDIRKDVSNRDVMLILSCVLGRLILNPAIAIAPSAKPSRQQPAVGRAVSCHVMRVWTLSSLTELMDASMLLTWWQTLPGCGSDYAVRCVVA